MNIIEFKAEIERFLGGSIEYDYISKDLDEDDCILILKAFDKLNEKNLLNKHRIESLLDVKENNEIITNCKFILELEKQRQLNDRTINIVFNDNTFHSYKALLTHDERTINGIFNFFKEVPFLYDDIDLFITTITSALPLFSKKRVNLPYFKTVKRLKDDNLLTPHNLSHILSIGEEHYNKYAIIKMLSGNGFNSILKEDSICFDYVGIHTACLIEFLLEREALSEEAVKSLLYKPESLGQDPHLELNIGDLYFLVEEQTKEFSKEILTSFSECLINNYEIYFTDLIYICDQNEEMFIESIKQMIPNERPDDYSEYMTHQESIDFLKLYSSNKLKAPQQMQNSDVFSFTIRQFKYILLGKLDVANSLVMCSNKRNHKSVSASSHGFFDSGSIASQRCNEASINDDSSSMKRSKK